MNPLLRLVEVECARRTLASRPGRHAPPPHPQRKDEDEEDAPATDVASAEGGALTDAHRLQPVTTQLSSARQYVETGFDEDCMQVCELDTLHLLTQAARYFLSGAMLPASYGTMPESSGQRIVSGAIGRKEGGGLASTRTGAAGEFLFSAGNVDYRAVSTRFYSILLNARDAIVRYTVLPMSQSCHPYLERGCASSPSHPSSNTGPAAQRMGSLSSASSSFVSPCRATLPDRVPSYLTWEQRMCHDAREIADRMAAAQKELLELINESGDMFKCVWAAQSISTERFDSLWASYVHMFDDAVIRVARANQLQVLRRMEGHLSGKFTHRPLFSVPIVVNSKTKRIACSISGGGTQFSAQPTEPASVSSELSQRLCDAFERGLVNVLAPPQHQLESMCRIPVKQKTRRVMEGVGCMVDASCGEIRVETNVVGPCHRLFDLNRAFGVGGSEWEDVSVLLQSCCKLAAQLASSIAQYVEDELEPQVCRFLDVQQTMTWLMSSGDFIQSRSTLSTSRSAASQMFSSCSVLNLACVVEEAKLSIARVMYTGGGLSGPTHNIRKGMSQEPRHLCVIYLEKSQLWRSLLFVLRTAAEACRRVGSPSADHRLVGNVLSTSTPADAGTCGADLAADELGECVDRVLAVALGNVQRADGSVKNEVQHVDDDKKSTGRLRTSCITEEPRVFVVRRSQDASKERIPEGEALGRRLQQMRDRRFVHSKYDGGLNPLENVRRMLQIERDSTNNRGTAECLSFSTGEAQSQPTPSGAPHVLCSTSTQSATASVGRHSCTDTKIADGPGSFSQRASEAQSSMGETDDAPDRSMGRSSIGARMPPDGFECDFDISGECLHSGSIVAAPLPCRLAEVHPFLSSEPIPGVFLSDLNVESSSSYRAVSNRLRVVSTELAHAEARSRTENSESSDDAVVNASKCVAGSSVSEIFRRKQRSPSTLRRSQQRAELELMEVVRAVAEEKRERCHSLQMQYPFLRFAADGAPSVDSQHSDLWRLEGVLCCNIPFEDDSLFVSLHEQYTKAKNNRLEILRRKSNPSGTISSALCVRESRFATECDDHVCRELGARLIGRVREVASAFSLLTEAAEAVPCSAQPNESVSRQCNADAIPMKTSPAAAKVTQPVEHAAAHCPQTGTTNSAASVSNDASLSAARKASEEPTSQSVPPSPVQAVSVAGVEERPVTRGEAKRVAALSETALAAGTLQVEISVTIRQSSRQPERPQSQSACPHEQPPSQNHESAPASTGGLGDEENTRVEVIEEEDIFIEEFHGCNAAMETGPRSPELVHIRQSVREEAFAMSSVLQMERDSIARIRGIHESQRLRQQNDIHESMESSILEDDIHALVAPQVSRVSQIDERRVSAKAEQIATAAHHAALTHSPPLQIAAMVPHEHRKSDSIIACPINHHEPQGASAPHSANVLLSPLQTATHARDSIAIESRPGDACRSENRVLAMVAPRRLSSQNTSEKSCPTHSSLRGSYSTRSLSSASQAPLLRAVRSPSTASSASAAGPPSQLSAFLSSFASSPGVIPGVIGAASEDVEQMPIRRRVPSALGSRPGTDKAQKSASSSLTALQILGAKTPDVPSEKTSASRSAQVRRYSQSVPISADSLNETIESAALPRAPAEQQFGEKVSLSSANTKSHRRVSSTSSAVSKPVPRSLAFTIGGQCGRQSSSGSIFPSLPTVSQTISTTGAMQSHSSRARPALRGSRVDVAAVTAPVLITEAMSYSSQTRPFAGEDAGRLFVKRSGTSAGLNGMSGPDIRVISIERSCGVPKNVRCDVEEVIPDQIAVDAAESTQSVMNSAGDSREIVLPPAAALSSVVQGGINVTLRTPVLPRGSKVRDTRQGGAAKLPSGEHHQQPSDDALTNGDFDPSTVSPRGRDGPRRRQKSDHPSGRRKPSKRSSMERGRHDSTGPVADSRHSCVDEIKPYLEGCDGERSGRLRSDGHRSSKSKPYRQSSRPGPTPSDEGTAGAKKRSEDAIRNAGRAAASRSSLCAAPHDSDFADGAEWNIGARVSCSPQRVTDSYIPNRSVNYLVGARSGSCSEIAPGEDGSLFVEYKQSCAALGLKPNSGLINCLPRKYGVSVSHLDLSLNYIGPKGLQPLLHVLQLNGCALRHLSLRDNNLESSEVRALVDLLATVYGTTARPSDPSSRCSSSNSNSGLLGGARGCAADALRYCRLKTLDLSNNPISYAGGVALLELISILPSLTYVHIDGTLMQEKQIRLIQRTLRDRKD